MSQLYCKDLTRQTDGSSTYRLYHLDVLCRVCVVQIQPGEHGPDRADFTGPTRLHELDHTDHADQEDICPERSIVDNQLMICRVYVRRVKELCNTRVAT